MAQSSEAVRTYIEETGLPFDILVDSSRDVLRAYGVWQAFGMFSWNIARPALFLVHRNGTIRYSFIGRSQEEFPSHDDVLAALDSLNAKGPNTP